MLLKLLNYGIKLIKNIVLELKQVVNICKLQ